MHSSRARGVGGLSPVDGTRGLGGDVRIKMREQVVGDIEVMD